MQKQDWRMRKLHTKLSRMHRVYSFFSDIQHVFVELSLSSVFLLQVIVHPKCLDLAMLLFIDTMSGKTVSNICI